MRRFLIAVTIVATTFGATAPAAEANSLRQHRRVFTCKQRFDWHRVGQRPELIKCLARQFNAPGSPRFVLAIGRCESGSDLQDTQGGDGHVGTYQHITSEWHGRWVKWGRPLALPPGGTNVLSQAVVSIKMARSLHGWGSSAGWTCAGIVR